jgi:enoyl-CoA hydratase/carnithine racemase
MTLHNNGNQAPVQVHMDSGLGIISLADGQGMNRLDGLFLSALVSAFHQVLESPEVRVVLLRSLEENFCLGMNLDVLKESLDADNNQSTSSSFSQALGISTSDSNHASRQDAVSLYSQLLELIAFGPKPVIGLVEGPVKAGGVGITAACDIVVADLNKASFELSEVLFGLIPANVLPFLMHQRISPQQARYLVLSAKLIDPIQALQMGLCDEIYTTHELEKGLKNLIKTMMRGEPGALEAAKRFIGSHVSTDFQEFKDAAVGELLGLMTQPAVAQGLEAFGAGATPPWFGKFKPSLRLTQPESKPQEA